MKLTSVGSLFASLQLSAALAPKEWAFDFLKGGCLEDWTKHNYGYGGFEDDTLDCAPIDFGGASGDTNIDLRHFQAAGKKLNLYKGVDINNTTATICGNEVYIQTFSEDGCYPFPNDVDPGYYSVTNA